MPTSVKSKSTRGENGREELLQVAEPGTGIILPPASSNKETVTDVLPASSPAPEPAVEVVDGSVKTDVTSPSPLSASDLKLARRMSKAIADSLGLSGKTRSVKI